MPKVCIDKHNILSAALSVLREQGEEGLNARAVARRLGCSTQPIYSVFENMNDLKTALRAEAFSAQVKWVQAYERQNLPSSYKASGMGFIRFAKEEKELFRFLYMQERQGWQNDPHVQANERTVDEIVRLYHVSREEAKKMNDHMSIFSFGLAVLQNRGADYSDEIVSELLRDQFQMFADKFFENRNKNS